MKKVQLAKTTQIFLEDNQVLTLAPGWHYLTHEIADNWVCQRNTVQSFTIIPKLNQGDEEGKFLRLKQHQF